MSAPTAGKTARWKGGGDPLDAMQVTIVVLVAVAAVSAVALGSAFWIASSFVTMQDVAPSLTVGEWQQESLVVEVGDIQVSNAATDGVLVALVGEDGLAYYMGATDGTMSLSNQDVRTSVSYFDADADGYVSAGDRLTVVVDTEGTNPLVGGQAFIAMLPEGYASIALP